MRRRAIYRGQVQGVGFRRRTFRLAQAFSITGFVRNCDDGTVELEVEGEAVEMTRFLAAIAAEMAREIVSVDYSDHPPCGFQVFEIRRS